MDCPKCGKQAGGIALVVGIVRVTTCQCRHCGKKWRVRALLAPFNLECFANEVERLNAKYPTMKPDPVKVALAYLQIKIDTYHANALTEEAKLRRRKSDLEDRRFLKAALGEDY